VEGSEQERLRYQSYDGRPFRRGPPSSKEVMRGNWCTTQERGMKT